MGERKPDVLQGTLDLMVLKTLDALGPLHGYGIALRIEQVSGDVLRLNQGTVYASLVRLRQRGWISSECHRRTTARFSQYAITKKGRTQLRRGEDRAQIATVIGRILRLSPR